MQLQPLTKGRFQNHWIRNNQTIKDLVLSCVTAQITMQKNEHVISQGSSVSNLYLVRKGSIAMAMAEENGKNFKLGKLNCQDQIFGEMEFFSGYRSQMSIICLEPCSVYVIDALKLQESLASTPEASLCFATAMAVDYQDTVDILTRRMLYPISYNIAFDLYEHSHQISSVEPFEKHSWEADRFATSDRAYRRAIKDLQDRGIIKKHTHHIEVADNKALEEYLRIKK